MDGLAGCTCIIMGGFQWWIYGFGVWHRHCLLALPEPIIEKRCFWKDVTEQAAKDACPTFGYYQSILSLFGGTKQGQLRSNLHTRVRSRTLMAG
jgi:hypothetical protein